MSQSDLPEMEFLDSPADVTPADVTGMRQSDLPGTEFLDSPADAEAATRDATNLEQTELDQALPTPESESESELEPESGAAVEPPAGDANEFERAEALLIADNPEAELAWLTQSELQQATLAEVDALSKKDPALLGLYLRDPDPTVSAAAFTALSEHDPRIASQALLDVVRDEGEPVRVQVLDLLLSDPNADKGAVGSILSAALRDLDSGIVASAVRVLGGRDDLEALTALAEALGAGDVPTRRLIVESIASNHSAVPLLEFGLNDPDEDVRRTAAASLFPPDQPSSPAAGEAP